MKIQLAWRAARVLFHLICGLGTCMLMFPWAGARRRERLVCDWSRRLLGLCRVTVEPGPGAEALAHALIVANHVSWLDIFVINSMHPCRFVAKAEIRRWPVLGWLAACAGTVFISRGNRRNLRHIFEGLVGVLEQGERVAFFPEGTTAKQGTLLPFHANLFEAAIDAKVAVQPYALEYLDAGGRHHPAVEYVDTTTLFDSLFMILRGTPVRVRLACLAPIDTAGAHRRELARTAQQAIAHALSANDQRLVL